MPEDDLKDDIETTHDETAQEPVEHEESLPPTDDPVILKQRLDEQTSKAAQLAREAREAKREAESYKERAEEERKGKEFWYNSAQKVVTGDQKTEAQPGTKAGSKAFKEAVKGMDILDYTDGEGEEKGTGMARFIDDLAARGVIATPDMVSEMLDKREQSLRTVNRAYRNATAEYPDLLKPDSPLAKEVLSQMETLLAEKPHLSEDDRLELACARAANKVGRGTSAPRSNGSGDDKERLRRANGGNGGHRPAPASTVITAKDRAEAKRMGVTKDEDILQIKRDAERFSKGVYGNA